MLRLIADLLTDAQGDVFRNGAKIDRPARCNRPATTKCYWGQIDRPLELPPSVTDVRDIHKCGGAQHAGEAHQPVDEIFGFLTIVGNAKGSTPPEHDIRSH